MVPFHFLCPRYTESGNLLPKFYNHFSKYSSLIKLKLCFQRGYELHMVVCICTAQEAISTMFILPKSCQSLSLQQQTPNPCHQRQKKLTAFKEQNTSCAAFNRSAVNCFLNFRRHHGYDSLFVTNLHRRIQGFIHGCGQPKAQIQLFPLIFTIFKGWEFIEDTHQKNSLDSPIFLGSVTLFVPSENDCRIASERYTFQAKLHSFFPSV